MGLGCPFKESKFLHVFEGVFCIGVAIALKDYLGIHMRPIFEIDVGQCAPILIESCSLIDELNPSSLYELSCELR